jgi:hypothetical protein
MASRACSKCTRAWRPLPGEKPQELVEGWVGDVVTVGDMRASSGFRMADILRHGAYTMQLANRPLSHLYDFLTIPAIRKRTLERVPEGRLKLWWKAFDDLRPDQQRAWVESGANKIAALVFSPHTNRLISQTRSTVDIPDIMAKGKRLIIDLNEVHLQREVAMVLG